MRFFFYIKKTIKIKRKAFKSQQLKALKYEPNYNI